MQDINPQHHQLDLYTIRSFQEYDLLRQTIAEELNQRRSIELKLIQHEQPNFFTDGFCAICGHESKFNTSFMYAYEATEDGKPIPNWREHLDCVQCGFTNRLRASMHIFYQRLKPSSTASIYITEQTTALFKWLKQRHIRLVGSEYLGDVVPLGKEKNGLRNEDLTALTFPSNSFDYILSFDVMEHVGDDIAALTEVYRCLKPGGVFMFTAPFRKDRTEKLVRAKMLPDGSIEHILPPEYHGNPVDEEHGSLCFRYFAWDLIDDMKKIGFGDPQILNYWSRDFAYLGGEQFIFIGTKPTA
jgi:SAM-dependent methyltransferase